MWNRYKIAQEHGVPATISIANRLGVVETELILAGYCIGQYNYKVRAKYPYSTIGGSENEYGSKKYDAVDFSGGPMLCPGDKLPGGIHIDCIAESDDFNLDLLIVTSKDE